jgi:hypothetical protein
MPRKLLVATVLSIAVAVAGIASVALAKTHAAARTGKALKMTLRWGAVASGRGVATIATPDHTKVTFKGFRCEVTVGVGPHDQTPRNFFVTDSTEFTTRFQANGTFYRSVVSNCVGQLPPGTVHSSEIVTHVVSCSQFNPDGKNKPTIKGFGVSTTYPDGLFSETCDTPNFPAKA